MLTNLFSQVLSMSLTASVAILAVCLARLILKKAPKLYSYMLWAVVLFRLLCPVSFFSSFSVIPNQISSGSVVSDWSDDYLGEVQIHHDNGTEYNLAVEAGREPISAEEGRFYVVTGSDGISEPKTVENTIMPLLAKLWITGIIVLILHSMTSYARIRKQTSVSVPFRKDIYLADDVVSPFVMGFFRPVIYLPGSLEVSERKYIIAHERHHIRRGDHIFKALGFLALTIHWFNPLVWLAFILASRDMEMSCDEAVIQKLGDNVRAEYSASLLNLATGQRLFAGTPLAFGEGDPTGRVRNLAKWKKPAFWVILLCVALCVVMAVCLLSNPKEAVSNEMDTTVPSAPESTKPAEDDDWGITIVPERVSRTSANAIFDYHGSAENQEGVELYYGDLLSLEVIVNDRWVPVEELPEYEYYVGDSSYPVMDGYGMVHEWQDRFGDLPDGHYRLGKLVTRKNPDGTSEERMIYGEFSLPDSILTGPIPLENLPELYSGEQAMIDGCFVQANGVARENMELFHTFAENTWAGTSSFIRIVNTHYGEATNYTAYDLSYDGSAYTISWLEDGKLQSRQFRYLNHFSGEKERENMAYDAYEHYVLVNENEVSWIDIWNSLISSQHHADIDFMLVYSDYIYYPEKVDMPDYIVQADLVFEGETQVTTTDFDRLEKIYLLFDNAEPLGYEPKTHSIGLGLNLILTSQNGEAMTIELDPDNDICRINGEYVFYGAYDEPSYVEKLWYYLGIPAWPDSVYEMYPNAFRPQASE